MIFKCYKFNKQTNKWDNINRYFSWCKTANNDLILKKLLIEKFISPAPRLRLIDYSGIGGKQYRVTQNSYFEYKLAQLVKPKSKIKISPITAKSYTNRYSQDILF